MHLFSLVSCRLLGQEGGQAGFHLLTQQHFFAQLGAAARAALGAIFELHAHLRKGHAGGHVAHALPAAEPRDVLVHELLDARVAPVRQRVEGDFILEHGFLVPRAVREQSSFGDLCGEGMPFKLKGHLIVAPEQASLQQLV